AGITPYELRWFDRRAEIGGSDAAEIKNILGARRDLTWIAFVIGISGADQRIAILIRNREDEASVIRRQEIGALMRVQARHHNVASLCEPDLGARRKPQNSIIDACDPRTRGIYERTRPDGFAAASRLQHQLPIFAVATGGDEARMGADRRALFAGADRI